MKPKFREGDYVKVNVSHARYKVKMGSGDVWRPGIVIGIGASWPESSTVKAGIFINVHFLDNHQGETMMFNQECLVRDVIKSIELACWRRRARCD